MQDKELEKILQEKADKTEMRDFSLVWEEIKGEITPKQKEKKSFWKNKFFLVFAPALLIVCIVLSPLMFQKPTVPPEKVYFSSELDKELVTEAEMFNGLQEGDVSHVDLSRFVVSDTFLYYTNGREVKGAHFNFFDESRLTFFAIMDFYSDDVDLNLDMEIYNTNIQVNSADVHYKFNSVNNGYYKYSVYATYNKVKYVIEYSGACDNLMEFLTDFFA